MKKKMAMLFSCLLFVFALSGCQIAENNFQAIIASFTKPTTQAPPEDEPTTEETTEEATTTESLTTEQPEDRSQTPKAKNEQKKTNQNSDKKNPTKKVDRSDNKKVDKNGDKVPPQNESTTEKKPQETTQATAKVVSISYDGTFQDTYYTGDEAVYSKQEVIATYDDGTKKAIPFSECQISGFDTSSAGSKTVKINYQGASVSLKYTVEDGFVVKTFKLEGSIPVIPKGGTLDTSGLSVTVEYNSGKSANIDVGSCDISGFDSSSTGTRKVTVSYQGFSDEVSYTVKIFNIRYENIKVHKNGSTEIDGNPRSKEVSKKQFSSFDEVFGILGESTRGAKKIYITSDSGGNNKVSYPLSIKDSNPTLRIYVIYEVDE